MATHFRFMITAQAADLWPLVNFIDELAVTAPPIYAKLFSNFNTWSDWYPISSAYCTMTVGSWSHPTLPLRIEVGNAPGESSKAATGAEDANRAYDAAMKGLF